MTCAEITADKETMSGTPVFRGTRVPVVSLFDHLEGGSSLDEFLHSFPSVTKEQAIKVLDFVKEVAANSAA